MLLIPLPDFYMAFLRLRVATSILTCMRTPICHLVHTSHAPSSDRACVICLYALSLKICYDISSNTLKDLCNILTTFRTRLKKLETMLLSQRLPTC